MTEQTARRRLLRDFKHLQDDPPPGISGAPIDADLMNWNAVIFGPEDTIWEGGTFRLSLKFSNGYPATPPVVRFLTHIFHPNVYANGDICLDILRQHWSPIYDIAAILMSIRSLLSDPNPNSPANSEAANLFTCNRREYNRRIEKCVTESWTDVQSTIDNNDVVGLDISSSVVASGGDETMSVVSQITNNNNNNNNNNSNNNNNNNNSAH